MKMSIDEVITELSMTYSFRVHLLLEGDDDRKFFEAAVRGKDKVNFVCAWGADNVTELIKRIDSIRAESNLAPTLGIIDRDYRIALGTLHRSANLLISDARDFECMMFDSLSFDAVLAEFGSAQKIKAQGGPRSIAASAKKAAAVIGEIRFYSQQAKIGVSFQKLEIRRLVDRKTLTIDSKALLAHLNARQGTSSCRLTDATIRSARDACALARCDKGAPYFQDDLLLCRGHDLMEILAIGFRSLFGSRSAAESCRENVEALFRLSYVPHFRATQLARSIEQWFQRNSLYPDVSLV